MFGVIHTIWKLLCTMRAKKLTRCRMLGGKMPIHGLRISGPHLTDGALVHFFLKTLNFSNQFLDGIRRIMCQYDFICN